MKRRTWQCYRCKRERIVGEEIARCDMHAICYVCLGAKPQRSILAASSPRGASVKSKRSRATPPGPNRSAPQKPDSE
jgi:hypothetical protein